MVRRTGSPVEVLRDQPSPRLQAAEPGLMLGEDQQGAYVSIRLFRPAPTRALLLGTGRLARLLALRAIGLGARLSLRSARPGPWEPVLRCAEELTRVGVFSVVPCPWLTVAEDIPVDPAHVPAHPWSTWLDTRQQTGDRAAELAKTADLVLAARLAPEQGGQLAEALDLPEQHARLLSGMPRDCVTLLTTTPLRAISVRVTPTLIELSLIG